jgi:Glycosyl transferase WecG/TagA/CpsF family
MQNGICVDADCSRSRWIGLGGGRVPLLHLREKVAAEAQAPGDRRRHQSGKPVTTESLLGVGAADMHAGLVPQTPPWMQRSGLEWLYRLGREPRRLWRPYLRNNPRFVVETLRRPPVIRATGELS